jgi:hypothetical protein
MLDVPEVHMTPVQHLEKAQAVKFEVHKLARDPQFQRLIAEKSAPSSHQPQETYDQGQLVKVWDEKNKFLSTGPYTVVGWEGDTPATRKYWVMLEGARQPVCRSFDQL